MPKVHGEEIVKKSRRVRYFGTRRVRLEYPPLARPVTEFTAWFKTGDSERFSGYLVSEKVYKRLKVPETIHDSEADRKAWEEVQARRRRQCDFVRP